MIAAALYAELFEVPAPNPSCPFIPIGSGSGGAVPGGATVAWPAETGPAKRSYFCGVRWRGCASIAVVDAASIGKSGDGLHFAEVQRGPDSAAWSVEVSLRMPGLDASLQVVSHYASGFDDLVAFFQGLAADWRGWHGERTYESLEHDLRLAATHDGHVLLAVQMSRTSEPDGWSASAILRLDPGEEMTQAANDVAALLATPP